MSKNARLGNVPLIAHWHSKMIANFTISTPTAIHFGTGTAERLRSVLPQDAASVLLVRGSSGTHALPMADRLEQEGIAVQQIVVPAEPTIQSVNAAFAQAAHSVPDAIIACGGGSVLDTAKALRFCLERNEGLPDDFAVVDQTTLHAAATLPLIAVPTTAGTGAEVTSNAVLGTSCAKVSLRGHFLFPSVALVDPALMKSAPKTVAIGAGLDALTQTIEAYTSCQATPYTDAITEPNLRRGARALRGIIERGDDAAWTEMCWVSLSSGLALANGGLGAAHGMASVLGERHNAPHGLLCGRLLAPVLTQNRSIADIGSQAFRKIENSIEALAETFPSDSDEDGLSGFTNWLAQHRVPRLRDYAEGKPAFDEFETAASASSSQKNAVPLGQADFRQIYQAAY